MSWTLCTSEAAIANAGANMKDDLRTSGAIMATWSNEAEGELCTETGRDWITHVSTLQPGTSGAVFSNVAARIAQKIIKYDITGYLTREADTLLNVNDDIIVKTTNDLKKLNTLQPPKS